MNSLPAAVKRIASALVLAGCVLGLLVWFYFPAVPRSVLGWIALVGLGIPVWIFLEWMGEFVFDSRLFKRRSIVFRVLVGVPVFCAVLAVALACVWAVQAAIVAA